MNAHSSTATLIGAPVEAGAGRAGCRMGPAALRIAGLAQALGELGVAVRDRGDLDPAPVAVELAGAARRAGAVAGWTRALAEAAQAVLAEGAVPVALGGDHSLSMGTIAGAARHARARGRPLHVLWLDAHADFNTPLTSPSGNMHGMPAAFLCGEPGFAGLLDEPPALDPARLHLFGVRSIDAEERALVVQRGVDIADMRRIDETGAAALIHGILQQVAAEGADLHVGLDVDYLDPELAPGVGTTVPGGATFREAHLVMELVAESGLMTGLDLVELNPFLDDRGRSARLMVELAASAFGRTILDRRTPAG
jgi:arginase